MFSLPQEWRRTFFSWQQRHRLLVARFTFLVALTSLVALVGTVDECCDLLAQRREEWGVSYVVLGDDQYEAFAPVVARLAGT